MPDDSTFGFNRADATDLLELIGGKTAETIDRRDRNQESFRLGVTQEAIDAGSYGNVLLLNPVDSPTGWVEGTMEFVGWAYPSAIGIGVTVACFRGYGRWTCFEVC